MTTPIRVALVGTGNCGRLALHQLIADPRFELTAVGVSTPEKVGRTAGELASYRGATSRDADVVATDDLDALLATGPQCVVYTAMGDTRPAEATRDVKRFLSAGVDVVGSAPGSLQFPWGVTPPAVISGVENAAADGGASLFVTGVDPGFANDLLPLALASTCQHVERVKVMEIADYATYDGGEVMFDVMGFGLPAGETPMLFLPGILGLAWGTTIRILAEALGFEIDDIAEEWEGEPTPEALDVAAGHIPAGGLGAVRFAIKGMQAGVPVVEIEHVTRVRGDLRPDWAQPAIDGGSYRVEITGEPSYVVDITPTSAHGDHNHAAIVAAAGRIVNAIPAVVAAPPGIRTTLDLPFVSRPGSLG